MATPNTDLIFKEFANGIRNVKTGVFYPYITDSFSPGTAVLAQKQNVRYYIRRLRMSYSTVVTDAGTSLSVTSKVNNQVRTLASLVKTTLLVNLDSQEFDIRLLLDKEAVVDFTATDITAAVVSVTYAEVSDLG